MANEMLTHKRRNSGYELLLVAVILTRSTSGLFTKLLLESMGTFTLLTYRFLPAFLLLALLFLPRLKKMNLRMLRHGIVIGVLYFCLMAAETIGLNTAAMSMAVFLENTNVLLVPLAEAILLRRAPKLVVLVCCIVSVVGIALLTLRGGHLGISSGELLFLLAALFGTGVIITTDRYSRQDDPLVLGVIQVGVIGVLSLAVALLTETPQLPQRPMDWVSIASLIIVCTGFSYTLQPVAQSRVSSEKTALFFAMSTVFATFLGVIFLQETFSPLNVVGGALILGSVFVCSRRG